MFGFLNVYKPVGKTSHDVVAYFRKLLKIKQIGHTGTLDPFAEGVLPVCIGKSTKLIEYLPDDKAYLAFVQLGKSTDSYDIEGNVVSTSDKKVDENEVKSCLKEFCGEILQTPPIYSAIKVKGKKLYEYAREGKEVEITQRKVFINKIELKSFDYENQVAEVYIECSKGTYIRSIANDLGEKLKVGGHLIKLIRTKAGKFLVENSIKMEDFDSENIVKENLLNPLGMLDLEKHILNDAENTKISYGQPILNKSFKSDDFVILIYNDKIRAIAKVDGDFIRVNKVFENA